MSGLITRALGKVIDQSPIGSPAIKEMNPIPARNTFSRIRSVVSFSIISATVIGAGWRGGRYRRRVSNLQIALPQINRPQSRMTTQITSVIVIVSVSKGSGVSHSLAQVAMVPSLSRRRFYLGPNRIEFTLRSIQSMLHLPQPRGLYLLMHFVILEPISTESKSIQYPHDPFPHARTVRLTSRVDFSAWATASSPTSSNRSTRASRILM
jgi:hypothetical protein